MCPWCIIGYAQLQKGLAMLEGEVEAEVRWLPFELNPDMPPEGEGARRSHRPQVWPQLRRRPRQPSQMPARNRERAGYSVCLYRCGRAAQA
jgi:predicted DsbA family dithiol-disulfide isomerase